VRDLRQISPSDRNKDFSLPAEMTECRPDDVSGIATQLLGEREIPNFRFPPAFDLDALAFIGLTRRQKKIDKSLECLTEALSHSEARKKHAERYAQLDR
jgi:hypothetical protein